MGCFDFAALNMTKILVYKTFNGSFFNTQNKEDRMSYREFLMSRFTVRKERG